MAALKYENLPQKTILAIGQLMDERAMRWAKMIAKFPALWDCYRMLITNPELAAEAAKAINKILAKHPQHRLPNGMPPWELVEGVAA